jgi:hypothetical protein
VMEAAVGERAAEPLVEEQDNNKLIIITFQDLSGVRLS